MPSGLRERLAAAAEDFAPGASERLVLPGTPAFRCIADECDALCCRAPYRADLDEAESARLIPLAEIEEHGAVALLAQDADGACNLLTADLRCSQYALRPRGCVQYPYLLHFQGGETASVAEREAAVEAWASGDGNDGIIPLLMRDPACPGFIGKPLSQPEWAALLRSIWQMQRTSK